ncbi:MAG: ATP-binding cassette domain-containing protein [Fusobacterium sp. JB021]|nr:ATP-binding cassette domain-containing protein [Fusobacterium sp. JB020]MDP0493535.1 ATP-binding cassette domain-containing protein [Fusobacterium sp. JB021]
MKINIKNLTKFYGNQKVLENINITIENINVLGIIGESGCGKSTLIKQLSGIEFPDKGKITINDLDINRQSIIEYQRKVGFVFQNHNLFPHLTIKENIMLVLEKSKGFSKEISEEVTIKLLKKFFLEEQKNKKPKELSGGQSQRASIARALAGNPDLIFLDEPTASLDPLLTKEVLGSIEILKKLGTQFIFITHEMGFLKKFADYFIFLDAGKIVEHGYINKLEDSKNIKLKSFIKNINI